MMSVEGAPGGQHAGDAGLDQDNCVLIYVKHLSQKFSFIFFPVVLGIVSNPRAPAPSEY